MIGIWLEAQVEVGISRTLAATVATLFAIATATRLNRILQIARV
jgi:hypothetical protein